MADFFDELDDVKDELQAEWEEFVAAERTAHLRKAGEEFDAAVAPKKRAWLKNRLLKRIAEIPAIDQNPITRERERHLPTGTRLRLKQIPVGGNDLFESTNMEVISAIRSCAYSLRDDGITLKTETTQSETGIILSVNRVETAHGA